LLLLALYSVRAAAQELPDPARAYPSRPIHIIVPFPAGGPTDILARVVGQRMSEDWGASGRDR
jgi:tripartite-type tricarboxylate transporter receptor subunit TctC